MAMSGTTEVWKVTKLRLSEQKKIFVALSLQLKYLKIIKIEFREYGNMASFRCKKIYKANSLKISDKSVQ